MTLATTNTDNLTLSNGVSYAIRFPSLRRVKELNTTLGIDFLNDNIQKFNLGSILEDSEKLIKVLKICLDGEFGEEILDAITGEDYNTILMAFFLKGRLGTLKGSGDIGLSIATTQEAVRKNLQVVTGLMSLSSDAETEIPKQ